MSTLSVRLNKDLEGRTASAVAEVVSSSGDVVYQGPMPAGYTASFLDIQVTPGDYLVRATLPSGEVVSQSVTAGDVPVQVDLRGRYSQHEWLSWHEFSAGKGGRSSFERVIGLPSVADELREGMGGGQLTFFVMDKTGMTATIPIPLDFQPVVTPGGVTLLVDHVSDEHFLVLRIGAKAGGQFWVSPEEWPRVYLGASLRGAPYRVIALPVPWPDPEGTHEQRTVEVLLGGSIGDLDDWSDPAGAVASLVVRDPVFGPVLSFLASGDPAAARTVTAELSESARDMLWGKLNNPYAAAAGGYVLLRSGGDPAAEWHDWPRNLANWFPWLPDGAVIYGWQLLKEGSAESLQAARASLIDATVRGIPVYTEGVRLLLQGLTVLSHEEVFADDRDLMTALKRARAFGVAVDPSKPFSTLTDTDLTGLIEPLVLPAFLGPSKHQEEAEVPA